MNFGLWFDASDNASREMIKGAPEIVDGISDDERKRFRNWLQGAVDQSEGGGLVGGPGPHIFLHPNGVKVVREGLGKLDQLVNVAIGPLNL
jgi:hypothetical protein